MQTHTTRQNFIHSSPSSAFVLGTVALLCLSSSQIAAQKHAAKASPSLVQAVKEKQYATLSALLQQKADVNARDDTGRTALMWAAWESDSKATEMLLRHRAKVNVQDKQGWTALWIATERGDRATSTGEELTLVRQLLKYGAKVSVKDKRGGTIFGLIADMERPDPEIVQLLKHARLRQQRQGRKH